MLPIFQQIPSAKLRKGKIWCDIYVNLGSSLLSRGTNGFNDITIIILESTAISHTLSYGEGTWPTIPETELKLTTQLLSS